MAPIKFQTIASDDPGGTGVLPSFVVPTATGVELLKDIATGTRVPVPTVAPASGFLAGLAPYILPLLCFGDTPERERPVKKDGPASPLPQRPVEWQQRRFSERVGSMDLHRQMTEKDRERLIETSMPQRYRGDRTTIEDAPVVMPEDAPPAISLPATPVPTVEDVTLDIPRHSSLPVVERYSRDPEAPHQNDTPVPHGTAGIGKDLMHDSFYMGVMDFLTTEVPKYTLRRLAPPQFQMSAHGRDVFPESTIEKTVVLPSVNTFQKLVRGGQVTTPLWTLTRLSKQVGYYTNTNGDTGFVLDLGSQYEGESMAYVPRRVARHVASRLDSVQINLPVGGKTLTYVVSPIGYDKPIPIVSELEVEVFAPRPISVRIPWTEAYLRHSPADYNPLTDSKFKDLAPVDWAAHSRLTVDQSQQAGEQLMFMWLRGRWPSGPNDDTHQFMLPVMAEALRDPKVGDDVKTILVSMLVNEGDQAFRFLTSNMVREYKPKGDDELHLDDHFREELELNTWGLYRFFPSLHDTQSLFPKYRPTHHR